MNRREAIKAFLILAAGASVVSAEALSFSKTLSPQVRALPISICFSPKIKNYEESMTYVKQHRDEMLA